MLANANTVVYQACVIMRGQQLAGWLDRDGLRWPEGVARESPEKRRSRRRHATQRSGYSGTTRDIWKCRACLAVMSHEGMAEVGRSAHLAF